MTGLKRSFSVLVLLATSVAAVFGQATSQLTGTVTDNTGAVIVGADLTVTNVSTGAERKVATNEAGNYVVPFLTPDEYRIVVRKQGFRSVNREGLRLEVNQVARLDFVLEIGAVTESINVTAAAPMLDSDTSSLGQVIENKVIEDLPLNGRNFVSLALISPGVSGVGTGARGTIMSGTRPDDLRPASEVFANGNREGSNNFLLDGIDNNERLTLSIVLRPSVEAVREFKIQTNMFAAEQGRNSGAAVNVLTKSGSNEWHGSAYEFLRNDIMDARNYFAAPTAASPALRQNQFGATFGGRIIRNKLFFFTNYEGFRKRRENTFVNTVPLPEMRTGDFTNARDVFDPATTRPDPAASTGYVRSPFPSRHVPANRFDSVMGRVIQAYPMPQRLGLVNNHITNPKDKQRWDQGDARFDWNLSDRNTIFGRYSRQDTVTTKPSTFAPTTIPGMSGSVSLGNEDTFAGDSMLVAHNAPIGWISTLTPTFIMEAKMGFNRFDLHFFQEGAAPGAQLGEKLGVKGSNQGQNSDGIPIFSPANYSGIGQTRSLPIIRVENTFHPSGHFTNIRGPHTVKFGAEVRRRQVTQYQTNRGNGRFNFSRTFSNDPNNTANTGDSMASLLLGAASTIEQDFTLVFPGIRMTEWGAYIQDDWKATDRLTLNFGLRYEYDTRISEVANRWTNFDVFTGKLLIAGFNTDANTGVRRDPNNFAPRFGFAYRLRPGTVLRGGYGIFYNPAGSESVLMRRHRQLPFGPINIDDINQFNPAPRRVQDGLRPIPSLDPNVVANNPEGSMLAVAFDFKSGYAQQYNLQVQQQLPHDMVAKLGYVGNLGRRLDTTYDYNQPVPGPGAPGPRRPLIGIAPRVVGATYNLSDGLSAYHSLQATLERRFRGGIGLVSNYTWGHSIDNVGNQFGGADNGPLPQDPRYRRNDRGTSGFDITHRFTAAVNYQTPFGRGRRWKAASNLVNTLLGGWDVNSLLLSQTGLPFTPVLATSVSNAGGSRPDRLKSGKIDNPDPSRWFDTSFNRPDAAWGVPQVFTYGNAGRNILYGPGRIQMDASVLKDFSPAEKWRLQFRWELFNLFNTPQFDLPNTSIGSPNAGIINRTIGTSREMQVGLRLSF